MIDDPDNDADPEMVAAEYALGLLDAEGKAATELRIATDQDFAARVARWEEVGQRWAMTAPADPDWSPANLWNRLEATFPADETQSQMPRPANDPGLPPVALRAAAGWRWGAMAASIAAFVFGGLYLGERERAVQIGEKLVLAEAQSGIDPSGVKVAQVSAVDGAPLVTVLYQESGGKLVARIATFANEGLVPELWVIGPDGKPRSLGQSAGGTVAVLELTEQMRADIAAGSSIAISLEVASDQPSAQPTAERILGAARLAPVT